MSGLEVPSGRRPTSRLQALARWTRARVALTIWRINAAIRPGHSYMRGAKGIIHVGANIGDERAIYARYGLPVLWFEPIPEIFNELQRNISPYSNQRAIQALLSSETGKETTFYVSSHSGASSSMMAPTAILEMYPDLSFSSRIDLTTLTLDDALRTEDDIYDVLVLDTQGSELLILQGAEGVLPRLRYINVEAADFEAYEGCCTANDIEQFLASHGFRLQRKTRFLLHKPGNAYYDLLFTR